MVEYLAAMKRPFRDLKKLLTAIVLIWIPIINFWVMGYFFECAKSAISKKPDLPEWKDWSKLWVRGLLGAVINLIYSIPLLILIGIFILILLSIGFGGFSGSNTALTVIGVLVMIVLFLLFLIIAVFVGYVSPMALLHFIRDYRFSDAFQFRKILKDAFTLPYLLAWLVVLAYSVIVPTVLRFIFEIISLPAQLDPDLSRLIWLGLAFAVYFILIIIYGGVGGITFNTLYGEAFGEVTGAKTAKPKKK